MNSVELWDKERLHHTRPPEGWSWREFYPILWDAGYDLLWLGVKPEDGGPRQFPDLQSEKGKRLDLNYGFVLPGSTRDTRAQVYFKAIPSTGMETQILHLLSTPPLALDPRNHTVPVLDIVHCGKTDVVVMPYFRNPFTIGPFLSYKQVYDFVDQILEGLDFLHENYIAHMDISGMNILWDDDGYRNVYTGRNPADVAGPYYFIDFQASQICTANPRSHIKELEMCTTIPPEAEGFRDRVHPIFVNAFALDVWNTGIILRPAISTFYELKSVKAQRLRDLVSRMLDDQPEERPTAREALDFFRMHKAEMELEEEEGGEYRKFKEEMKRREEDGSQELLRRKLPTEQAALDLLKRPPMLDKAKIESSGERGGQEVIVQ